PSPAPSSGSVAWRLMVAQWEDGRAPGGGLDAPRVCRSREPPLAGARGRGVRAAAAGERPASCATWTGAVLTAPARRRPAPAGPAHLPHAHGSPYPPVGPSLRRGPPPAAARRRRTR